VQRTLVDLAISGDEEAFATLARSAGDRLFAVAYRILRDVGLAEDAVQQALITAWRELPNLRDGDRFHAWLRRLLVHACYAEARRDRRWSASIRLLPTESSAPDDVLTISHRDQLDRGFRRLPPEQRAVFVFHHYLGLSLPEIADQLGVPLGTVKSRMHYATAALRSALDADARTPMSSERPA
jgi:RNA polymerase sigma-70 factor, ECF subfamily